MNSPSSPRPGSVAERNGTIAAFAAYGIWTILPVYMKALSGIDAIQILCHRIVWAAVLTVAILAAKRGGLASLRAIVGNGRRALMLSASALLIGFNWGMYIWAVTNGKISDSSLGYFINPLLSIALGALFFRERLDGGTVWAVGIAVAGIIAAAALLGNIPWVSLSLAFSFAFYGLVKKKAGLDPLTGLAAETLALAPFALAWILREQFAGRGSFAVTVNGGSAFHTVLLMLSGLLTAAPLLAFAYAANRISMQKLGFLQYISPTGQLFLGVLVYGERPDPSRIAAFCAVAVAIAVFAFTRPRGISVGQKKTGTRRPA